MQAEVRAIAKRYDMAVMGPNSEGFANIAANLCPTFSPAMEAGDRPLVPAGRPRPQLAVAAQSGGIGFAFFDHGRAKELSFRYIVTTGNEACLEALDFADFILDEGKTDALLLLLEDIKTRGDVPPRGREGAEGRQAHHRQQDRPVRCRRAGGGIAYGGAGRHLRRLSGDVPALRHDRRPRHRRDGRHRRRLRRLGPAAAARAPRRHLHGLGRRRRLDGGRLHGGGPGGAGARCRDAPAHRQAPAGLRHLAEPGRCHGAGGIQDRLRRPGRAGAALADGRRHHPRHDGALAAQPGAPARGPGAPRRDDAEADPAVELHAAGAEVGAGPERGRPAALHRHRQLRAHHAGHGRLPRAARALPAADRGDERGRRRTRPRRARLWRRPARRCASGRRGRSSPATASAPIPPARWPARRRRPSPRRAPSAAPSRSRCSRRTSCTRRKPAPWR